MNLHIDQLDYNLPSDLIARTPAEKRDQARLMVVRPGSQSVEHRIVADLPNLLQAGDLMVVNDTRVIPARFHAMRIATGGRVEGLFLEPMDDQTWHVLLRSGGKLKAGERLALIGHERRPTHWPHELELMNKFEDGSWVARKRSERDTLSLLDQLGEMPLPPYIRKARSDDGKADDGHLESFDRERYQTVYANEPGAVAAPTAGLHLTEPLLADLDAKGVSRSAVTLHVGMGTFQPVRSDYLNQHPMHTEKICVTRQTWEKVTEAKADNRRVVAVGTTTVRTLESLPLRMTDGFFDAFDRYETETDLLIQPGFHFNYVNCLLTNFHLPRSTLLALVGAMVGIEWLLELYEQAVSEGYRFYSYGDAMLILPDG